MLSFQNAKKCAQCCNINFPQVLRGQEGSGVCVTLTGSSFVSLSIEMENTPYLIETSAAKDKTQRLHSCLKV